MKKGTKRISGLIKWTDKHYTLEVPGSMYGQIIKPFGFGLCFSKPMFALFLRLLGKNVLDLHKHIYKHESDKNKEYLSVFSITVIIFV